MHASPTLPHHCLVHAQLPLPGSRRWLSSSWSTTRLASPPPCATSARSSGPAPTSSELLSKAWRQLRKPGAGSLERQGPGCGAALGNTGGHPRLTPTSHSSPLHPPPPQARHPRGAAARHPGRRRGADLAPRRRAADHHRRHHAAGGIRGVRKRRRAGLPQAVRALGPWLLGERRPQEQTAGSRCSPTCLPVRGALGPTSLICAPCLPRPALPQAPHGAPRCGGR